MAQICKGICSGMKSANTGNPIRFRYRFGQKYCSECALFFNTEEFTCVCCKTRLRSKSKSKKYDL